MVLRAPQGRWLPIPEEGISKAMKYEQFRGNQPLPHDQTHRSHRSTGRICTDGGRDSIDSIAFIDRETGSHVAYDGPFTCDRDGHCVDISMPIGEGDSEIIHQTASNLADRTNDIAVTTWATEIETTGIIEAADVIEDTLVVRINDRASVSANGVDDVEVAVDE